LFRGTFLHTIDSKGRVSVPNRFRETLRENEENTLVLTKGTHQSCLAAYPLSRWQKIEENLDNTPAGRSKDNFIRHYISPAQDCGMDKMGRILIPANLRSKAGLEREIMIVGALSKFEVWDKDRLEAYYEATEDEAQELMETREMLF
ncbi:MAG: division/cell wall cluster transcriptional repressor MraZ, partial [Thermodesulfobacteriota bacterium]|nr:division/cell wall cluster transcriptional repressor MraZ [Thermodesulfobacteriota bacterium]